MIRKFESGPGTQLITARSTRRITSNGPPPRWLPIDTTYMWAEALRSTLYSCTKYEAQSTKHKARSTKNEERACEKFNLWLERVEQPTTREESSSSTRGRRAAQAQAQAGWVALVVDSQFHSSVSIQGNVSTLSIQKSDIRYQNSAQLTNQHAIKHSSH